MIIIIIIIIKTSGASPSGKTKLFINCIRNPTSTRATENWNKQNSEKQPMIDYFLKPIQHTAANQSVGKVIPHTNLRRQGTSCKFACSNP